MLCSLVGLFFYFSSQFLFSLLLLSERRNDSVTRSLQCASGLADSSVIAADRQYCTPWWRWREEEEGGGGGGRGVVDEDGGRRLLLLPPAASLRIHHMEFECEWRHLVAATTMTRRWSKMRSKAPAGDVNTQPSWSHQRRQS